MAVGKDGRTKGRVQPERGTPTDQDWQLWASLVLLQAVSLQPFSPCGCPPLSLKIPAHRPAVASGDDWSGRPAAKVHL